ncbi:primosomal protein N' [Chromatium weissei]|nr:primosomal protein N' [Chromatium weissei]
MIEKTSDQDVQLSTEVTNVLELTVILQVAVDVPLLTLFDYLPPLVSAPMEWIPGLRLLVPFGTRQRVGILMGIAAHSECAAERLKRVNAVLDAMPLLTALDLQLIAWAASYYQQPVGEALFTALPPHLRKKSPQPPFSKGENKKPPLEKGGLGGICETGEFALNADQDAAVNAISAALGTFQPFLLDGVTGSGKTEVYIQLISQVIAAGQQALVIVPEIGLTPQLQHRLTSRLSGVTVVLHSRLKASERARNWELAALGTATLVLGTRSAIFVPLPHLALIVVDEEHDQSLKQQDGFRYSARDVAVRRAQLVGCPVVLGSATPALETFHNAQRKRYGWLQLPRRAGVARPPKISLLDIRQQPLRAGLSMVLRERMETELAAGNQILLFLNRRGYAPVLMCHSCGWIGSCSHCDARLTLHLSPPKFWCHHCERTQPVPQHCPDCKSADLRLLGRGTERLEEELQPLFPETTIVRIDSDSTSRQGELKRLLGAVKRGEVQIVLGTQMLAKGHDFPGITLVGILDLDGMFYANDFRATERTAQLIVQVAGRAGRAERAGQVILQTRHPEHPLLQSLLRSGYHGFMTEALREREAAELPPFAHLALLRADATDELIPFEFLREAKRLAADIPAFAHMLILGPAASPLARRLGRYHAQLLVQCTNRAQLQRFLKQWRIALHKVKINHHLHWSIDVDPQEMF